MSPFFSRLHSFFSPYILVIITILCFILPALLGWEPVAYDDALKEFFPRQFSMARIYQQGEIPLWDHLRFLGALPYHLDDETSLYNFFLLPFYFIANLDSLNNSFYVLYLIPFSLALLLCSYFSFLLALKRFQMSSSASFLFSIIYTTSHIVLIDGFLYQSNGFVYMSIPALIFFLSSYLKDDNTNGKFDRIGYICATSFLIFSGSLNIQFRFFAILFILFLYFFKSVPLHKRRHLFNDSLIILSITSFYWISQIKASYFLLSNSWDISSHTIKAYPLKMFASLIYPDIFNTVFLLPEKDYSNLRLSLGGTAGNHLLSGGLIASYFNFSYIHKLFKQNLKGEITVFIIFTLLLLSSFDIGIFNILNPFFKIPFPFYNRFTWCLFFAFIVSIELDRSLTSKNQPYFLRCFHLLCVLSVVCWAYLSGHFVIQTHFYLHFSLYIIFLLFINKKKYKYLIIFFLLFEAIYPAYQYFYHSGFLTIKNNQLDTKINGTLYKNINDNPLYQQKDSITGPFISDQSMINNFSWLNNQPSVLGFDAKPLSPLFYTTLKNFLRSFPWDSNFDYISLQFLKNIGTKNFYTLNKSFFVDDMYLFSNGEKSLLMNSQKIQTPAPFAFFPTQIKKSNQEKQLDHILWDDIMLKSHAHVNLVNSSQNQILSLERKNNSITIKVRQPRNSILILNQTFDSNWTSLDKETEIFPINYFQTGILIKGVGVKKVSLSYWPSEWNLAFLFILLSACLMIFIKAVNIYRIKSFVRHMSQHIIK